MSIKTFNIERHAAQQHFSNIELRTMQRDSMDATVLELVRKVGVHRETFEEPEREEKELRSRRGSRTFTMPEFVSWWDRFKFEKLEWAWRPGWISKPRIEDRQVHLEFDVAEEHVTKHYRTEVTVLPSDFVLPDDRSSIDIWFE